QELKEKDLSTYGFLGYPVLQAADILVYNAHKVPIGEDQRPHLELTREIARRFNNLYGKFFNEPQEILTEQPKLPGIDGRKMSKSYNNAIYLTDAEKDVTQKVRNMFTDPAKIKKNDRGNPDNCVVFAFHCVYNESEKPLVESECRAGSRGCVDCKMAAAARINESLMPVRERRAEIDKKQNLVLEMIEDGNRRAKAAAEETMSGVRKLMRI
ncbi:MAG TPA: tryptophan--tRNA ligase, partial [Candidatus Goldiibacteriota bacterium]|nr:tryptophan--tRNA ligase [Candidatus Goldiibacteriota bacterium]